MKRRIWTAREVRRLGWAAALLPWLAGCSPMSFLVTPVSARHGLEEHTVLRESPWAVKKIALVDVDGVLRSERTDGTLLGLPGENPVSLFREKLDRAAQDTNVQAIVVRIDSPGGSVTASDLMYTELRRFREQTGKPIIACMMDVAASGGYYLACAADRIYAHPTTVTGSIGVIVILPNVVGTMEKIGVRTNVFKSGALKDAGSPFREMNDRDKAVFQGIVDDMYERFLAVVRRGRPQLTAERVRELADGRVYTAREAHEAGLIDDVGTLNDALAAAKRAAGIENRKVRVVAYSRPLLWRANVYAESAGGPAQVNVVNLKLPEWLDRDAPQIMYLWAPGW
jgi:protease-4